MKCDELKRKYSDITGPYYGYNEVDEAIAELKAENAELKAENAQLKKETEFMHSNCKWHVGDGCARLLGEKLAIIDDNVKLKQKLEDAKATAYAESVDAGMENRKLKRALWLTRAERAKTIAKIYSKEAELILLREHYPSGCGFCHIMNNKWRKVEQLCRAKAEQYK